MVRSIYVKQSVKYFLLFFIGGFFSYSSFAQWRGHEKPANRPDRNFTPRANSEPRTQAPPPRPRNPQTVNQSGNRWRHDANRPEPRQLQVNNNAVPGRPRNPSRNNDHFQNNNRPYSSGYHNNGRPEWRNRRPVYSSSNPGWRYSYLPRRNSIVTRFSYPYQTIYFGGYGYRYCDGVYYRPYNNVFRVVAPPFGIFINVLPFGYRRIVVHDYPYYYYNGTYYDEYQSSYRVVAPPLGAVVESIPEGYETIVIDGETYYKVDDVQYKPVVQDNGEIWYQVIKIG